MTGGKIFSWGGQDVSGGGQVLTPRGASDGPAHEPVDADFQR